MSQTLTCSNCAKPINRGKWCSDKCRKSYVRAFEGKGAKVYNPDKTKPGHTKSDNQNEWFNSATTKTQQEIELHYTLANLPLVKYHSVGGGGYGANSPYPRSDARSKAYI